MINPYEKCPVFETKHFTLRLVSESDIEDLLVCYSDPKTQAILDTQNFAKNLHCSTAHEMARYVRFWLEEYRNKMYVRFAIVDRKIQKAIGTVEMFSTKGFFPDCNGGILRIDLASPYETEEYLSELLQLANDNFFEIFGAEMIITKGRPGETARLAALSSAGYKPYNCKTREHYMMKRRGK